MCQTLRVRWQRELATAVVVEMRTMVTVMTWKAVAAPTHSESKVHGCLQRVSICVEDKGYKMETHQCYQGHISVPRTVHMELLDGAVNTEDSNLKLQMSAKCMKSKRLTWDARESCSHAETF